jgi:hypothetical protein
MCYADGCAVRPVLFVINEATSKVMKLDGSKATQAEIEALNKSIDEFYQKDSLVKQQVFNTISDRLLL